MHAPIPAAFSLLFLPLSFFLSVLSLLLVSYYYPSVGCSLFGLLGRPLGLAFHWAFLHMGLWTWIQKMGINIQPPEHMDCSCDSYAKTYAVFFRGLFHNLHVNASLLFFARLLFQSLLSLGKSFSFFLQIHDPSRVAKKLFMTVVVLLLSPQSEFVANFASFGPAVCFPNSSSPVLSLGLYSCCFGLS